VGRPGQQDVHLGAFYKEWSHAKLPASFQNLKPVPKKPPIFPGTAIQNDKAEEAKKLVIRFIEAMHDYERQWRPIYPLNELPWDAPFRNNKDQLLQDLEAVVKEMKTFKPKALRERTAIVKQFATDQKSVLRDAFAQLWEITYDPERDQIAEVREVLPTYLIVYMHPVDGVTIRYHLKDVEGNWLIDYKDKTSDHVVFKKIAL
jgi:hypothetical protein